MPALQIRDLPSDLYEGLKARAKAEHRSLAQEATVAIERHLTLVEGGQAGTVSTQPRTRSIYELNDDEGREERIAKLAHQHGINCIFKTNLDGTDWTVRVEYRDPSESFAD